MTGDKSLLSDFKEKKGPKIKFGGGVKLTTLGSGNTSLGKLKLTNVLYVAGLDRKSVV